MNDEAVIICVTPDQPYVPESTSGSCSGCGCEIMVSPSGRNIIREQNAKPICEKCAEPLLQEEEAEVVLPNREQLLEIAKYLAMDD